MTEPAGRWVARLVRAGAAALVGAPLLQDVVAVAGAPRGIEAAVADRLAETGVSSAVTGVLLAFRGYDTLLEVGVLLAALVAVWSLGPAPDDAPPVADPILGWYLWLALPLLVLGGGALLVAGATRPGGAFQGGAVIAGAGVLRLLTGRGRAAAPWWPPLRRWGLALGVLAFGGVALATLAWRGVLLAYGRWGAAAIVGIEVAVCLSVALLLPELLRAGTPPDDGGAQGPPRHSGPA